MQGTAQPKIITLYALGTVCIFDRRVRRGLDSKQRQVLADLAGVVMDMMEFRRLRRQTAQDRREG